MTDKPPLEIMRAVWVLKGLSPEARELACVLSYEWSIEELFDRSMAMPMPEDGAVA